MCLSIYFPPSNIHELVKLGVINFSNNMDSISTQFDPTFDIIAKAHTRSKLK